MSTERERYELSYAVQTKHFRWMHPVLPLIGSKARRWWREIQAVACMLPDHARVLDAFAGTCGVSRVMKDIRHDLRITANDVFRTYRKRLEAVPQTIALWHRIDDAIQETRKGGQKSYGTYDRFTEKEEAVFRQCLEEALDKTTVASWGNGAGSLRNKVPVKPVDAVLAAKWLDGIDMADILLGVTLDTLNDENVGACLCTDSTEILSEYDFVVLDPPYLYTRNTRCRYEPYTAEAAAWCMKAIQSDTPFLLWDREDSENIKEALKSGTAFILDAKHMGNTGKDSAAKETAVLDMKALTSCEPNAVLCRG